MPRGYLALVLHAHLPYVRHPEHATFLEERWFFEAITETYIPLIRMLERLEDDAVDYSLLISLSPPLVTMFEDEVLQERYVEHMLKLIDLADREVIRTAGDEVFGRLSKWYADEFRSVLYWFEEKCKRRLAMAFRRLAGMGHLELMTCGATHGLLPLLKVNPGAVRAQIHTAVEYHTDVFGVHPGGIWVPECAYYPGLEKTLADAGIKYFFVDSHGLENATHKPRYGVYAPIYTESGVAAFARDKETSHQVWSSEVGYPGHPDYREFYRDVGFELDEEAVMDFMIDGHIRCNTGIKYYRITKRGEEKDPYDPDAARERAAEHAGNFLFNRARQLDFLCDQMDRPPLVVSPYDAELFGHWWFEGPQFLDYLFRKMCFDQDDIKATTPLKYLAMYSENQVTTPAGSSWGGDGTYEFWLNETNDAIYRDLHRAADRMSDLVDRSEVSFDSEKDVRESTTSRVLRQMARELLLAQSSDWPFIMRTGTSPEYAQKRVANHLSRFRTLEHMLSAGRIDEEKLGAMEFMDKIFPRVNPGWYSRKP